MVVDRRVALLNSNNIQDRPNMEMMIHIEGKIVESFYDMALYSWYVALTPTLPLLKSGYQAPSGFKFGLENQYMTQADLDGKQGAEKAASLSDEKKRIMEKWTSSTSKTQTACEMTNDSPDCRFISGRKITITDHLNAGVQPDTKATISAPDAADEKTEFRPHAMHAPHSEFPVSDL
jgi:hypothetical protein